MRYLLDQQSYEKLMSESEHTKDCYARDREYLHHMYVDGVKYVVAHALSACLKQAQAANDSEALKHLRMHEAELRRLVEGARSQNQNIATMRMIGEPVPVDEPASARTMGNTFRPPEPQTIEDTHLNRALLIDLVARGVYVKNRVSGADLGEFLGLNYAIIADLLLELRNGEYIDIVGSKGYGDLNYEYMLTTKGNQFARDAMQKTQYTDICPVTLTDYIESVKAQTIKNVVVTRRNIRDAFQDLIMSEAVLNPSTRPPRSSSSATRATARPRSPSASPASWATISTSPTPSRPTAPSSRSMTRSSTRSAPRRPPPLARSRLTPAGSASSARS
jgi:hypothetical protein